jgi:hypothetical protein
MQMTAADQRAYPKLKYYVKNSLPQVVDVPAIVNAMRKIGQLTKSDLQKAVQWGSGPMLKIVTMSDLGQFSPGIGSSELRLQKAMVEEFEAGNGTRKTAKNRDVFLVGVTILHELVHYGDDQDSIDHPDEEGEVFERMVYGAVIV